MAKFDPNRPHGVTYGEHAAAYEQDGKHFKADGTEVTQVEVKAVNDTKAVRHAEQAKQEAKPDDQVSKQAV